MEVQLASVEIWKRDMRAIRTVPKRAGSENKTEKHRWCNDTQKHYDETYTRDKCWSTIFAEEETAQNSEHVDDERKKHANVKHAFQPLRKIRKRFDERARDSRRFQARFMSWFLLEEAFPQEIITSRQSIRDKTGENGT